MRVFSRRPLLAAMLFVLESLLLTAADTAVEQQKARPLQLASAAKQAEYETLVPVAEDPWLKELLGKKLTFYTNDEIPRAYQHDSSVHSPLYNISAVQPREPFGNAAMEFPWVKPAGTHSSPDVHTVRFFHLPPGRSVRYWTYQGEEGRTYDWAFPRDTVFGEILTVKNADGYYYPFEVRTRIRGEDDWSMRVFRPFPSQRDLGEAIRKLPGWDSNPALQTISSGVAEKEETYRLRNNHAIVLFDETATSRYLPAMAPEIAAKLLWKAPFKRTTAVLDFSTEARSQVVPKHYEGSFLEVSKKSCMRCHDSAQTPARRFDGGRDWYGLSAGSKNEGILSWHPFEPGCISYNGFNNQVVLRRDWLQAGILKHWNDPAD